MKFISLALVATLFLSFLSPPVTIFGDFKSIKMVTYNKNVAQSTFFNGLVKLYPQAVESKMMFKATKLGNVSLNNKQLKYQNNMKAYIDSIERVNDEGVVWSVSTSSVFSAFTYSCPINYPQFIDVQNIPDTISRSGNYIINLTGVQNADFAEFIFDDLTFHVQVPWYRKVNASNGSIIIPGSNFNSITAQYGLVRLVFTKGEDKLIDGKLFRFENRLMLVKPVVIVN